MQWKTSAGATVRSLVAIVSGTILLGSLNAVAEYLAGEGELIYLDERYYALTLGLFPLIAGFIVGIIVKRAEVVHALFIVTCGLLVGVIGLLNDWSHSPESVALLGTPIVAAWIGHGIVQGLSTLLGAFVAREIRRRRKASLIVE